MSSRWSLVEYGAPQNIVGDISREAGLSHSQVRDLILRSGERAGKVLGFSSNPIAVLGDSIRATDLAGQLRVSPGIEVEIAPKFLGSDDDNSRWREDFFFLATLSRHGRLLALERLKAGSGQRGDLYTLVARSMVEMFWRNHRRPNRAYRLTVSEEFAFDGDVDPEEILQPGPDGYSQSAMVFTRSNHHNATILAAAKHLLPSLRDPSVIAQLERMISMLSPQSPVRRVSQKLRLPSRAIRWQPLYDLSIDVLRGLGLAFVNGNASAPGYVLDTWRVWEDLLGVASRMGFGAARVLTQNRTTLGTRCRIESGKRLPSSKARVSPDISILNDNHELQFLVDAKYKGRIDRGTVRISEADLYESLAFAQANKCRIVVLAYPEIPRRDPLLGRAEAFEHIVVGSTHIVGVEVDIRGISSAAGLATFASRFSTSVKKIVLDVSAAM